MWWASWRSTVQSISFLSKPLGLFFSNLRKNPSFLHPPLYRSFSIFPSEGILPRALMSCLSCEDTLCCGFQLKFHQMVCHNYTVPQCVFQANSCIFKRIKKKKKKTFFQLFSRDFSGTQCWINNWRYRNTEKYIFLFWNTSQA